jgi:hypothetical protein
MPQASNPFQDTPILCGAFHQPRQMLAEQTYGGHRSIHDDDTANRLGLRAGPIEGPTHFSQFAPLLYQLWGHAWFETGCLSAHYQNMVVEGEEVRAFAQQPAPNSKFTRIWAEKRDGTPVLTGTASIGPDDGHGGQLSEIRQRMAKLRPPGALVINRDLRVGQKGAVSPEKVSMAMDQHMGDLYPFTLADKLRVITEPCHWYTEAGGVDSPWGRPVIPMEMISVLLGSTSEQAGFRGRGPVVGLFAGQEIRLIKGPLFAGQPYELEREIVALSESARTESVWVRTTVRDGQTGERVAEMILNSATMKASYPGYEAEAASLASGANSQRL